MPLDPPTVPSTAYDEAYYRHTCAGAAAWHGSDGAAVADLYRGYLTRLRLEPGEVVVDVGCGRGELVALAAEAGATAVGVEYSRDAVALARRTLAARGASHAAVVLADGRALPLADAAADVVALLDVVEHLAPAELAATLAEVRRVLRPGGRVVVHTMPTRTIYDVTYRVQRVRPGRRHWPVDPRNDEERALHVNEQTARSLRRALRAAGFRAEVSHGAWVHTAHVPDERAARLYARLAAHRVTRALGAADLWGHGVARPRQG